MTNQLFDLLNGANVDPELLVDAARCNTVYAMIEFFLKRGATLDQILKGVNLPFDYLSDGNNWISYRDLVVVMKNCQDSLQSNTIYDWATAGSEITAYSQTRPFRIIAAITGIQFMYRKSVDLISTQNKYTRMWINHLENGFCDLSVRFLEKFNQFGLGHAGYWFAGVFSAFPVARGGEPASIKVLHHQMILRNLIEVMYEKQGFDYQEQDGLVFVNGVLRGKRIRLRQDDETGLPLYDYDDVVSDSNAILLIDQVEKDGVVYLKRGEIFDAPSCRIQLRWQPEKGIRQLRYHLIDKWGLKRATVEELEKQIKLAEERYFAEKEARESERLARIRAETAEERESETRRELEVAHQKLQEYADHLEDLVEERTAQLVEAEKLAAVGRLSFGVGHDLRNALATAINSGIPLRRLVADLQCIVDMLKEGEPTEEIATYLSRRKISSRMSNAPRLYETMMGSLTQALDNVKALEGYAVQDGSDLQDVRIEDVIGRVLQDCQEELRSILVETSFEGREYAFQGNPLKLYDVVQNLVINAIEALRESANPVLRITTQIDKDVHRTTVEDNGHGMSEEVRRHAFEPFYTTKGLAEGRQRGLGLFNVWRLVEQHSGTIEVQSEPRQYTRFQICFKIGMQATD